MFPPRRWICGTVEVPPTRRGVQKRGGSAKAERTDVAVLDAKFDEIYQRGGIYNFLSHPQWLDYGSEGFYERHLAHVSHRRARRSGAQKYI
jgi:hypothetical protein